MELSDPSIVWFIGTERHEYAKLLFIDRKKVIPVRQFQLPASVSAAPTRRGTIAVGSKGQLDSLNLGAKVMCIPALAPRWVYDAADAVRFSVGVLQQKGLVLHVKFAVNCSLTRVVGEQCQIRF